MANDKEKKTAAGEQITDDTGEMTLNEIDELVTTNAGEATEYLRLKLEETLNAGSEDINKWVKELAKIWSEHLKEFCDRYADVFETVNNFIDTPQFDKMSHYFKGLRESLQDKNADIRYFVVYANIIENIDTLLPLFERELAEYKAEHGITELSLEEFIEATDENGELKESIYEQICRAAQDAQELFEVADVVKVTSKSIDEFIYPLDKLNTTLFTLLPEEYQSKEKIEIKAEKDGSEKKANIYAIVNFDEIEDECKITKQLDIFDKRCFIAACNLLLAGNEYMSIGQIAEKMHCSSRPNATMIKKINDSFTKMGFARVFVDTTEEHKLYPNYEKVVSDFPLLSFKRETAYINNQIVEGAIHVMGLPELFKFAMKRKQITTVDERLLKPRKLVEKENGDQKEIKEIVISMTPGNSFILDYLVRRIAAIKNKKSPHKILFTTVFEYAKLTDRMQKKRGKQTIYDILDDYTKLKHIKGYRKLADGVFIET